MYVDTNASSGLTAADLEANTDVGTVAPVLRGRVDGREDETEGGLEGWRASGIDNSFLATAPPALDAHLDDFASDAEAWAAVAGGEPFMIADSDFGFEVGDSDGQQMWEALAILVAVDI